MIGYEWIGFAIIVLLVLVAATIISGSRLPLSVKRIVYIALAMRVVGALTRHGILYYFYGGVGDAVNYFRIGMAYAAEFWTLEFSAFTDSGAWWGGKWWGSQFMFFLSGIVQSMIGPTMRGEFVVFSLFAFLGLVGFAVAFKREFPHISVTRYAAWLFLFPSLWFWPSSVGKDAIILMGLGLVIAGYIGYGQSIRWGLLALGLFFIFAIRPQVAAVTVVSLAIAQWLGTVDRWYLGKILQATAIVCVAALTVYLASSYLGIESLDIEGVTEYIEANTGRGMRGGSGIEEVETGISSAPTAFVNILFRPFPWEASSPTMLLAALETWGMWVAAWIWRRRIIWSLKNWRSSRLLRVAIPFILIYSVLLGMLISNLGIIARQRIFLFPFIFILFEAAPLARQAQPVVKRFLLAPQFHPRRRPQYADE